MPELSIESDPMGRSNWPGGPERDSWAVTLRFEGRTMTVPFHMGTGHNGQPPVIGDILSSLASDASIAESCADVDEFVAEFGMSGTVSETVAAFEAVQRQASELRELLGDAFDLVVFNAPDGGDWSEFRGQAIELAT